MQNKKVIIALVVILVILIAGGGYLIFGTKQSSNLPTSSSQEQQVLSLNPSDIGLTMTARDDKHAVKFTISKASDITSVDYELDYNAAGNIPRGVIGTVTPKNGTIDTNYLDLGTCSSGTCKYDAGVTSVDLVLKVTKTDGKVYQVKDSLDLTQ